MKKKKIFKHNIQIKNIINKICYLNNKMKFKKDKKQKIMKIKLFYRVIREIKFIKIIRIYKTN